MSRISTTAFGAAHPLYVAKAERKGRARTEVDEVVMWLTGFDDLAKCRPMAKILRS